LPDSQTGLQLRQRGLGIDIGGLVVQLIGVATVSGNSVGVLAFVPLLLSAGAVVSSYVKVKNSTGTANVSGAITVVLGLIAAVAGHDGYFGFFMIAIGAAIVYFGNKQLAAGIRA
jgi:hypothetical protein